MHFSTLALAALLFAMAGCQRLVDQAEADRRTSAQGSASGDQSGASVEPRGDSQDVAGAYLTADFRCGPDGAGLGCGYFRAGDGHKLTGALRDLGVDVQLDDGTRLKPKLTPAPAASVWSV